MIHPAKSATLEQGNVLVPGLPGGPLFRSHRIIAVDHESQSVWCIEQPGRRRGKVLHSYVKAPFQLDLANLKELIREGKVCVGYFATPAHWLMSDEDYLADAPNKQQQRRRKYRQEERERHWNLIKPLVEGLTPLQLVRRLGALRGDKEERAEQLDVTLPTVYTTLHRYLAHGCMKNGLLPDTDRCGGAGKERKTATKRLGRPPKAQNAETADFAAFILTDEHKEQIGHGYALVAQGLSPKAAFLLCTGAFWATPRVCADGKALPPVLWPAHQRPTQNQFERWGPVRSGIEVRKRRFSAPATHRGGSSQDLTCAIGQLAMIDSTPTDVYLTSIFSRLRKLPPPLRMIVREVRCGAILGFHVGWEPASPRTALLAISFSAMPPEEKVAFAKSFGVESTVDDWIGMLCRQYIADNGEMRAAEIAEAEEQLGITVLFAKTYFGAGKGDVEAQHYVDHCLLDHTLPGASTGRPVERGQPHPADKALWNFSEYMHEYLEHVLTVNRQEVPELAPIEMLAEGVKPTRVNIARWMMNNGMRADVTRDIDQLKAQCLPRWPAVIQHDGVYLKLPGSDKLLPLMRFFSNRLLDDPRYARARTSRRVEPIYVRLDPMSLRRVWLPTSRGLIPLENVSPDAASYARVSIWELIAYAKDASLISEPELRERQQREFETVLRRVETTDNAKRQKKSQEEANGGPLPKGAWKGTLKANSQTEQRLLGSGTPRADQAASRPPSAEATAEPTAAWSVIEMAQAEFLRSLS